MSNPTITVTGLAVVAATECVDGHSFVWHSQPKIGCVYELNELIPSAEEVQPPRYQSSTAFGHRRRGNILF